MDEYQRNGLCSGGARRSFFPGCHITAAVAHWICCLSMQTEADVKGAKDKQFLVPSLYWSHVTSWNIWVEHCMHQLVLVLVTAHLMSNRLWSEHNMIMEEFIHNNQLKKQKQKTVTTSSTIRHTALCKFCSVFTFTSECWNGSKRLRIRLKWREVHYISIFKSHK